MAHFKTNDNTVEKILFQEEVGTYSSDTGNIYYQSVYAKVTDISTKSDIKEIRSDATQYLKDIVRKQDISHPTLGKIRVSNKGIKEFINESANPHKLALVPHLKELIETSTIGKEEAPRHPRKDNIVSFIPLYNDAIIDNKAYNTKIWIGKDNAGNLFYDVKLQEESTETGGTKNKSVVSSDTLNISITEKDTNVNKNIEDTILNQNANGFFDSELKAIVLGSNFNFGTLPHEMAHFRKYENHIAKINATTEKICKSKQEWRNEEIFYTKNKFYPIRHKSAEELQERYQSRLYNYQKSEENILQKIKETEERITELTYQISVLEKQHFPRKLKRKQNKLAWAKKRLFELEQYLFTNKQKQNRYEYLFNKWNGIMQKIILANITLRISEEKKGTIAPYYGFNDNRETSKYIHEDNK